MRIVFIDIDTLRPDHLGCYNYHRNTSPNIDRIAQEGVRFDNCYVPDAPCLPSRAALHHGRFGIHNGAINHGGRYADPIPEGAARGFHNSPDYSKLVQVLQRGGFYTASISSFAGRHNSWWFLAGFNEVYDCGKGGNEIATEVTDQALAFIDRKKDEDNWFLHFNIWDPHTPYRAPEEYGNPFAEEPVADWVQQEMIDRHRNNFGPHSANTPKGYTKANCTSREVDEIKDLDDYKVWVDGYDCGIRYADDAIGKVCEKLQEAGIYENTAIIVTSDHGENQGELNVYGDHQTADRITCRVPMIVKWPGVQPRVDQAFYYQFDVTATLLEKLGLSVPGGWDAKSFYDAFENAREEGRDYLVVSMGAWSCQRAVIWADYILIKTYMDGLKELPELMLFNWKNDPHELEDLSEEKPEIVNEGLAKLNEWLDEQLMHSDTKEDPMLKVMEEGGPFHARPDTQLPVMLDHYKKEGRDDIVEKLKQRYGIEKDS